MMGKPFCLALYGNGKTAPLLKLWRLGRSWPILVKRLDARGTTRPPIARGRYRANDDRGYFFIGKI